MGRIAQSSFSRHSSITMPRGHTAQAQQEQLFQNSWFWGVHAGGTSVGTPCELDEQRRDFRRRLDDHADTRRPLRLVRPGELRQDVVCPTRQRVERRAAGVAP